MREFATRQGQLSARQEDGRTLREHLQGSLERARGKARAKAEAALAVPPLPRDVVYLWRLYVRIAARRMPGMGDGPVTWADLQAFQAVTGASLNAWEIEMIELIDDAVRQGRQGERSAT